jgi:hypothetical protein
MPYPNWICHQGLMWKLKPSKNSICQTVKRPKQRWII